MQRIPINRVRAKVGYKRGGGARRFDLTAANLSIDAGPDDILDLDAALVKLT